MPESFHADSWQRLVLQLTRQPGETEWVEFKHNTCDPTMIAERISALSNGAVLCERPHAYLIWGVDDKTHEILGTTFDYRKAKKGNQELESWLAQMISPKTDFSFHATTVRGSASPCSQYPPPQRSPHASAQRPISESAPKRGFS